MNELTGRIHSLESFGTLDGPGVRFVVFFQGCPLRCGYCHNPDTWPPGGGKEYTSGELFRRIESCRSFIRSGGVTLSGGEPLLQPQFARVLLNRCRTAGFHTALDTAGSLPLADARPVLDAADLVLLDLKALDPSLCRKLTGQDNRHTLATLDYCEAEGKAVWIRHVAIPGLTMEPERLRLLARHLRQFRCVERVELIAYHKMAAFKWQRLGIPDPLADTPEPAPEEFRRAELLFAENFR